MASLSANRTLRSSLALSSSASRAIPRAFSSTSTGTLARRKQYAAARKQYDTEGYAILRNVISTDLVGELSNHLAYLEKRFPGVPTEHLHHLIMRNDAFWLRVASDDRLLDLAQAFAPFLEDGNIALFSSHYFYKKPRTGMAVLWHQDGAYWPLKPMNVLTAWLAVDRSDRDNGCLRVVRRSHTTPLRTLVDDRSTRNVLGSATHVDSEIRDEDIVRRLRELFTAVLLCNSREVFSLYISLY